MRGQQPQASVLLLPLPLQGPVNCFLKLAHLLSLSSDPLNINFLCTEFVHHRLSDLPSRFPRINFSLFSDGISGDDPRPPANFAGMIEFFEAEVIRRLPDFLTISTLATCLIADGVFTSAREKANELEIPVVYFSTLSPCCIWASCLFVPKLVDSGEVPFRKGMDLNEPVSNIPGAAKASLRWCDLPGVCRTHDMSDRYTQLILKECRDLPKAQGHILNTFDDLEEPLLAQLHSLFPNLYTVGPIHLHSRLQQEPEQRVTSNSFWQEDRSCIAWLDGQPSRSVIFVSFGSVVWMTMDQLIELWYGLVNSGTRFLWVRRPSSILGMEDDGEIDSLLQVPAAISEGTQERGYIVKWAPQEEVLAHLSVGGFLTHSGWNSTLESIVEGVPMLCWPNGIDQLVISRFVEVWKLGIDMKDKCDRVVVDNMIRDLMQGRRDEFSQKANRFSQLAAQAVGEGGSSWQALHRLIEDIRFMRLEVSK